MEGIDTGHLKVKVLEGRVGAFRVTPVDAEGKPTEQPGNVPQHIILREIPFQVITVLWLPFDALYSCYMPASKASSSASEHIWLSLRGLSETRRMTVTTTMSMSSLTISELI